MTTDSAPLGRPRGLRELVHAALPPGARPTDTACRPLHSHVIERSQDDVVDLTRRKMGEQFGDEPHVVIVIRDGDLDPATDQDLVGLMRQTEGGVLVFGVSYAPGEAVDATTPPSEAATPAPADVEDEECPECGSTRAFEVQRSTSGDPSGRVPILCECRDCGAVWDSYLPAR